MRCLNFIFFRLIPTWVIRCELRIQLHLRERNRKKIVLLRIKCPAALEHEILLAIHSLPLEISDDALLKSGRIEIILSDAEKILAENLALFPPDDIEIPVSLEEEFHAALPPDLRADIRACRNLLELQMNHPDAVAQKIYGFVNVRLRKGSELFFSLSIVQENLSISDKNDIVVIMSDILHG